MGFLNWAEMSPIGEWISTSLWGYPIALTLHTIGMGTLVGLALMICLRVLGLGQGMLPSRLTVYWKLALIGFVVNFLSGTALFFGSATVLWESGPFRIKIIFIAAGLIGTHCLVKSLTTSKRISIEALSSWLVSSGCLSKEKAPPDKSTLRQKVLALVVMACWLTALVAGRLIAYIF